MDDKTLQALTALANKLGTTAEYLWGVLLRQAPIAGVVDIVLMLAWGAVAVLWLKVVIRKTKPQAKTYDDRYPIAEWREESAFFAWASAVLLCVIAALIASCLFKAAAAAFFNPEYWALKQIIK